MQPDYEYILKIFEEGSFSKAADSLYLTQPALSIAIRRIESAIGMPLFDRTHRPLTLTPAGQIYIEMIKNMQFLEDDLERQLQDIRSLNSGNIKIGGSHYINSYILPKILSGFNRKYPHVHIDLIEDSSAILSKKLTEREIDLTFSCNSSFIAQFEKYPAFYDHILLAVPSSHPINKENAPYALTGCDVQNKKHLLDSCPSIPLSAFRDLDYILLEPGNNLYDRSIQMFSEAGFTPNIKLSLSQLVTAYHLAESSFGATFVSDHMIHASTDQLYFYKLQSEQTSRLFYILLPNRYYTTHSVKMFIQYFLVNWSGGTV